MNLTSQLIKEKAYQLGASLCGIASIDRFSDMPDISNPEKILPGCKTIIVIARKFLLGTTQINSTIPYTIVRNKLSTLIDLLTIELSYFIEEQNFIALPTGAIEPCNYNHELSKSVGLISLKNAAHQAGLGTIGKNTLLITPEYGNMVWLGAVLTTADLDPDPTLTENPCKESCYLCLKNCPVNAIKGDIFMDQKKCWDHAFGTLDGGEWRLKCHKCRSSCPFTRGYNYEK